MDSVSATSSATPPADFLAPQVRSTLGKMSKSNQTLARRFLLDLGDQGRPQSTLRFYARAMEHLARTVRKPFHAMTRGDITAWLNAAQRVPGPRGETLAPQTIGEYLKHNQRFFQWLRKGRTFDGIRFKAKGRKRPIEVLDEEDIRRMAQATLNHRDRALVMTLYALGCRAEGLANLRVKAVRFSEHGAIVHIRDPKTTTNETSGPSWRPTT